MKFTAVSLLVAACAAAQAAQKLNTLWKVDYLPPVSEATRAVWRESLLRLSPNGTFKVYKGMGFAGRYSISDSRVHLIFDTMFDSDVETWSDPTKPVPPGVHLKMDLIIRSPSLLENGPWPTNDRYKGATFSRVVWRPAVREKIATLFDKLRKIEDPSDQSVDYIFDELTERRKETTPILIGILRHDQNADRAYWAAATLGDIGSASAIPDLILALKDKRKLVVLGATIAVGNLKAAAAVPALISALKGKRINAYMAGKAFGQIGDKRAVPVLLEQLTDPKTRSYVIEPLGKLGDPRALTELRKLESDTSQRIREVLPGAIARLAPTDPFPSSAIPDLYKAALDSSLNAISSLSAIRDPLATAVLAQLLKSPTMVVRREAVDALLARKDKSALPSIKLLLKDDEKQVREAAWKAARALSRL